MVTVKPWNIKVYNEIIKHYPGVWHLISVHRKLTAEKIKSINPKLGYGGKP